MTPSVAAYTSLNLAYLDRAVVLRESVRLHHPEWHLVILLVDELPTDEVALQELASFDEVMTLRDLDIEDVEPWVFGYDVIEACTAVKGTALVQLLARGFEKVIYLDPDIALFRSSSRRSVPLIARQSWSPRTS